MVSYHPWQLLAIAIGISLTGIEVWGSGTYLLDQQGGWNYIVSGGIAITSLAAAIPFFAERAWRSKAYLRAVFLWLTLPLALSITLLAAVDRIGGARDVADRDRQVSQLAIGESRDAKKAAEVELSTLSAQLLADRRSGVCSKCKDLEGMVAAARKRVSEASVTVVQTGVAKKDPQAWRVAAILPISEEAVAIYQPLLLPAAIAVLAALLIAVGARGKAPPLPRKRIRSRQRVQAKRGRPRKQPLVAPNETTNVVKLRR